MVSSQEPKSTKETLKRSMCFMCFLQDFGNKERIGQSREPIETAYDLLHNTFHDKMELDEFYIILFFGQTGKKRIWSDREKEDFITILYDSVVESNEGLLSELENDFRSEVFRVRGYWIRSPEALFRRKGRNSRQEKDDHDQSSFKNSKKAEKLCGHGFLC